MGNLLEAVSRAWAHRKLGRGQCKWCSGILPDNAPSQFCQAGCEDAFKEDRHPVM